MARPQFILYLDMYKYQGLVYFPFSLVSLIRKPINLTFPQVHTLGDRHKFILFPYRNKGKQNETKLMRFFSSC